MIPKQLPGFRPLENDEEWHLPHLLKPEMFPEGYRPLLKGEPDEIGDDVVFLEPIIATTHPDAMKVPRRTKRPLPPSKNVFPSKHLLESKFNDKNERVVIYQHDDKFIICVQHALIGDDLHVGHVRYTEPNTGDNKDIALYSYIVKCHKNNCDMF